MCANRGCRALAMPGSCWCGVCGEGMPEGGRDEVLALQRRVVDAWSRLGSDEDFIRGCLARMAAADHRVFLASDGTLANPKDWPAEAWASVKGLEFGEDGRVVNIQTEGRLGALRALAAMAGVGRGEDVRDVDMRSDLIRMMKRAERAGPPDSGPAVYEVDPGGEGG